MSDDRITPYGGAKDRIDEIVLHGLSSVHIEMMDNGCAWMRLGDEVFWIHAKKNTLTIRHAETWPGYSQPVHPHPMNVDGGYDGK